MFDVFSLNNLYFSFFCSNFAPDFGKDTLKATAKVAKINDIRKIFEVFFHISYKNS